MDLCFEEFELGIEFFAAHFAGQLFVFIVSLHQLYGGCSEHDGVHIGHLLYGLAQVVERVLVVGIVGDVVRHPEKVYDDSVYIAEHYSRTDEQKDESRIFFFIQETRD